MNDLKADFVGYALIFINNIVTTIHFNNIKKLSEKHPEIDSATSSFYMSTLSIPVLIFLVYFGESEAFNLFNRSSAFYFLLFISLNTGITLTFSQNWCTVVNSPIVTSITGNVKDVGLTAISMFLFDDIIVNTWLVLGIILSLAGAFTYSIPKIQEDTAKKD